MNDFETRRPTPVTDSTTSDIPLVDLDQITPDQSLLADVRKTRITTPVTRALLALVVIGGAVLGGAVLERSQHKTSSSSNAQSLISQIRAAVGGGASGASGASGAGGGAAALFGGGGNGGATIGTVKLVDGSNVYVQDIQGNTIKVTTSPSTKVTISKTGTVNQLTPGSSVIVQGKQNASGTSMSATSISPSTGFGGGRPGAGGAGAPTAGG